MDARARRLVAVARAILLVLAAGCVTRRPAPVAPPATAWREWPVALAEADRLTAAGHRDSADVVLVDFVRRWPGTPEAEEGTWSRVVRLAERADDSTSTALLVGRIDSVLAASPTSAHRADLLLLRRLTTLNQQLRTERTSLRAERDAATRQRAEELDRVRAELDETKAELERVRKRVTRRRP